MHMIYMMRYSFFGLSGWQSAASKDAELLFDPKRLDEREYFLEKVAARSLADQSDKNFDLIVLSSTLMPEAYQKRLSELCGDMLGRRAHVIFREPDSAGNWFQRYRKRNFTKHATTTQIVLDDDDAVAVDFTANLRAEAEAALTLRRPNLPDYVFISHPRGITARFNEGQMELTHRLVPATNLGLAVVAPTGTRRNPFHIAHKKIIERRPVRVIYSLEPHYIRAVHGTNDSRAHKHVGTDLVKEEHMPTMLEAFPLLKDLAKDWQTSDEQKLDQAA
ncbi:glycosyltransferase [Roseobacteraceae bacterium S113]